jgi:hypothetical protein
LCSRGVLVVRILYRARFSMVEHRQARGSPAQLSKAEANISKLLIGRAAGTA